MPSKHDILKSCHAMKKFYILVGPRKTVPGNLIRLPAVNLLFVEINSTGICRKIPGNQVK